MQNMHVPELQWFSDRQNTGTEGFFLSLQDLQNNLVTTRSYTSIQVSKRTRAHTHQGRNDYKVWPMALS